MTTATRALIWLLLLLPVAAGADGLVSAKQTIFGMDCAPCAYGIEKGLSALAGVDTVTVSLNDGYAELRFGQERDASVAAIRQVIRDNGFSPREAIVDVTGRLTLAADGSPELQAGGERFSLSTEDAGLEETLRSRAGQRLELRGKIPADNAGVLVVTAIGA